MGSIAPNLSTIVGSVVATKLIGIAGGLSALAKMHACNVQVLGLKKKNHVGFSCATSLSRVGCLEQTKIFQSTHHGVRARVGRLVAPPARQPKPLHVLDSEPKKRRGGCRLRKMKEMYEVTDMRKLVKRTAFSRLEKSSLGDGLGEGYGMLGQAGSNMLRVSSVPSKLNLTLRSPKSSKIERQYVCGATTFGLTSSLAFTLVQSSTGFRIRQ